MFEWLSLCVSAVLSVTAADSLTAGIGSISTTTLDVFPVFITLFLEHLTSTKMDMIQQINTGNILIISSIFVSDPHHL